MIQSSMYQHEIVLGGTRYCVISFFLYICIYFGCSRNESLGFLLIYKQYIAKHIFFPRYGINKLTREMYHEKMNVQLRRYEKKGKEKKRMCHYFIRNSKNLAAF